MEAEVAGMSSGRPVPIGCTQGVTRVLSSKVDRVNSIGRWDCLTLPVPEVDG